MFPLDTSQHPMNCVWYGNDDELHEAREQDPDDVHLDVSRYFSLGSFALGEFIELNGD